MVAQDSIFTLTPLLSNIRSLKRTNFLAMLHACIPVTVCHFSLALPHCSFLPVFSQFHNFSAKRRVSCKVYMLQSS